MTETGIDRRTPALVRLDAALAPLGRWLSPRRLRTHGIIAAASIWFAVALHYSVPALHSQRGDRIAGDFYYFYTLGSIARSDQQRALYDAPAQTIECERVLGSILGPCIFPPSFYGPQVALAFAPLSRLPYWWATGAWLALTSALYFMCIHLMWQACPHLQNERRTVFILALAYPAFLFLFTFGQTTAPALACVTAAYLALRAGRPFLAGLAIGSLVYKPQLGLAAAAVFLGAREWRIVAGAVVAATLQLAVGWLRFGSDEMLTYFWSLAGVGNQLSQFEPKPYHMHSLRTFFSMLLPPSAAWILFGVTSCIVVVWAIRGWRSQGPLPLRFSLVLLATVLIDPHLHGYDLVILAPALLLLADWTLSCADERRAVTLKALLYLAYVLPLIGPLAMLTRVQVSVLAFAALTYLLTQLLVPTGGMATPRIRAMS